MKKLKNCIRCGKEFKPSCNAQKYCSVCASVMYWRAKKKKEKQSLGSLNAEARAAGYGYTPHWSTCNAPDKFRKK